MKPTNAPAIALYESVGMTRRHASRALEIAWSAVDALTTRPDDPDARAIEPDDDARVEQATNLLDGQLANARASGRVLFMLENASRATSTVSGATIFDPSFPGAYPFRVARPAHAVVLLRALRPFARPEHASVQVVTENQPDVADALVALGAVVKMESVHFAGPLPDATT